MDPDTPAPPPEARLIRTAREAAGMTAAQAAAATATLAAAEGERGVTISATYWRDVERGYGGRRGQRAPARVSDMRLAAMARVVGVSPRQLGDVRREGAARVLDEILRRTAPSAPVNVVGAVGTISAPSAAAREAFPGDPLLQRLFDLDAEKDLKDELLQVVLDKRAGRGRFAKPGNRDSA